MIHDRITFFVRGERRGPLDRRASPWPLLATKMQREAVALVENARLCIADTTPPRFNYQTATTATDGRR